jgi:hypothetical protein
MDNSVNPLEIYANLIDPLTFGAIIRGTLNEDERLKAVPTQFELKNLIQWGKNSPDGNNN